MKIMSTEVTDIKIHNEITGSQLTSGRNSDSDLDPWDLSRMNNVQHFSYLWGYMRYESLIAVMSRNSRVLLCRSREKPLPVL